MPGILSPPSQEIKWIEWIQFKWTSNEHWRVKRKCIIYWILLILEEEGEGEREEEEGGKEEEGGWGEEGEGDGEEEMQPG